MEKTLDLKLPCTIELGREELIEINGGGWLGDPWDWVKNAATDTWEWTVRQVAGLSELIQALS